VIEGLIRDIAESLNEEPFRIFPVDRSTDVAAVRLGREAEVNAVLSDTRDHISGMLKCDYSAVDNLIYLPGLMSSGYDNYGHMQEVVEREGLTIDLTGRGNDVMSHTCMMIECESPAVGQCMHCGYYMCVPHLHHQSHFGRTKTEQQSSNIYFRSTPSYLTESNIHSSALILTIIQQLFTNINFFACQQAKTTTHDTRIHMRILNQSIDTYQLSLSPCI
jgi:hypothetical protein